MRRILIAPLLCLLCVACGVESTGPELGSEQEALQGKAGTYTVTLSDWATVQTATTPAQLTLPGSSSRNLTEAFSWVPDDAFGETTWDVKQFAVTLRDGHEINTVLSGSPLFVRLQTASGTPNLFQARVTAYPAFFNRTGTSAFSLAQSTRPVMVRDPVDPLRYRVFVTTNRPVEAMDFVLPSGARIPATRQADDQWSMDLTFGQVHSALGQTITVEGVRGETRFVKNAVLTARVQSVAVTSDDPSVVWPTACEPAVRACLALAPADLGSCGDYYQVRVCRSEDPCLGESTVPSLVPVSDSALAEAVTDWNAATGGYTFASVAANGYQVGGCGVTLEQVVDLVGQVQGQGSPEYGWGQTIDRATLEGGVFCGGSYSSGGPALLQAMDAFGADASAEAWSMSQEVPCHGCHGFEDWTIVYYPATRRAIALSGTHGYD